MTRPRENTIKHDIMDVCRHLGGIVYNLDQGYRPGGKRHGTTRQTKGLGDLYVQFPAQRAVMWIEVKRPGWTRGEVRPEQWTFQAGNEVCGVVSVVGAMPEVLAGLRRLGFRLDDAGVQNRSS